MFFNLYHCEVFSKNEVIFAYGTKSKLVKLEEGIIEMCSKLDQLKMSQQLNEPVYNRFMEFEDDERQDIIKQIKNEIKEEHKGDNRIKFKFTDNECIVVGDKCIEAIAKLIKKIKITYEDIKVEYPPEWSQMDIHKNGTKLQFVMLEETKDQVEFNDVKTRFFDQLNINATVDCIERIQNIHLWENFYCAKKLIESKYKNISGVEIFLEKLCFHATHFTDPKLVIDSAEGIDRRYTHDAWYGNGAYFAKYSKYSANDRFVYKMPDGRYQMMLCRVCLGVVGLKSDLECHFNVPKVNAKTGKRFDSVADQPIDANRNEYVVFNNDQSYPQWLITFKKI